MVATSRVEFSLIEYRKALRLEIGRIVNTHVTSPYDQSFYVKSCSNEVVYAVPFGAAEATPVDVARSRLGVSAEAVGRPQVKATKDLG